MPGMLDADTATPSEYVTTAAFRTTSGDPFADLDAFVALPQVTDLAISGDGSRLVAVVALIDSPAAKYVNSLWAIDPDGKEEAVRLSRSAEGESAPAFLHDGSLLFLSERPDPSVPAKDRPDPPVTALWRLPATGEPQLVASRPGGITAVAVARDGGTLALLSPTMAGGPDADHAGRRARRERKVSAILHEDAHVRHWDHDLGPEQVRLLAVDSADMPAARAVPPADHDGAAAGSRNEVADLAATTRLRDLTPEPGRALDEAHPHISANGHSVVTEWRTPLPGGRLAVDVVLIDRETGERQSLTHETNGRWIYAQPALSPDGRRVVCLRERIGTPDEPSDVQVWLIDVESGTGRAIGVEHPFWPNEVSWSSDGNALFAAGDENGHHPAFRIDPDTGAVTRLTAAGAYHMLRPSPDGRWLYGLGSSLLRPPQPVRLDAAAADQQPRWLPAPGVIERVPGKLAEVGTEAADGTPLHAWLVLPPGAAADTPAPLLLWVHGGPLASWNDWHWRWNAHVMAARGWAVLLPDPALSTGYGDGMIRRGWDQWGGAPYTDVLALTDAALQRPDLDADRTAMMGGSYGGYMANWIAGHTDRFRAIVSHASLWSLDRFEAITDYPDWCQAEWRTPEERPAFYDEWSPDRFVNNIHTPMLIVHGDKDYRCPVADGIGMWTALQRRGVEAKFLYFPDEGHWILRPGDRVVWYATVIAFLDHYVLGRPWQRPALI
jgi:dipeptidyl aminopeptidase/acylaminoacyl peptidase